MRVLKGQLKKHLSTSESSYLSSDSLVFKGSLGVASHIMLSLGRQASLITMTAPRFSLSRGPNRLYLMICELFGHPKSQCLCGVSPSNSTFWVPETKLKSKGQHSLCKGVCRSLLRVWAAHCKWFWLMAHLLLSNTLEFIFLISYHSVAILKSLEIILNNTMDRQLRKMFSNGCIDFLGLYTTKPS